MRHFIEFIRYREYVANRNDIKTMILDAIQANPDSETVENAPLADYEQRERILSYPELEDIIKNRPNRGSIIQMVQAAAHDTNITVGTLINAIVGTEIQ